MFDHQQWAGSGILEIQDKTDDPSKLVDLWMGTTIGEARDQDVVWSYTIDGVVSSLQHFYFPTGGSWHHVSTIYVGYAHSFTFHIEPTLPGSIFTGPVDFTVDLWAGSYTKTVSIKDGDVYKKAIPFVNVDGVWQPAAAWIMSAGEWVEAS